MKQSAGASWAGVDAPLLYEILIMPFNDMLHIWLAKEAPYVVTAVGGAASEHGPLLG